MSNTSKITKERFMTTNNKILMDLAKRGLECTSEDLVNLAAFAEIIDVSKWHVVGEDFRDDTIIVALN